VSSVLAPRPPARKSFRETQFEVREEAILDATNRLLAIKGYEPMSMDDIAAEVGVAKGSLYKHFESKDALVSAVMVRLLQRTRLALAELATLATARERLEGLLRWTLQERLAGAVPHLPSTSQALRDSLLGHRLYVDELLQLSDDVSALIRDAKREGSLNADLDDEFILYTFYARSCDPTLDFLRQGGSIPDARIVDQMVAACFNGIGAAAPAASQEARA
jgi:AcrR family transcriptional regulator